MPEANWRPSFRLKERRRRGEELRSSSPLTYWPWRAWSTECEARSKKTKGQKKKKPASQLYFVSEIVLLSNRIRESILVWHRTLWHNGQFELQTVLTCLTRSFEVVCTGTTGFSNSEIGFRPRQKRSSFCSSFLPTESTVLENHLCMLCLHYCDYLHVIWTTCTKIYQKRVQKSCFKKNLCTKLNVRKYCS